MRKHRTVKFVAALIFLAALFYCLASLIAAVWIVRGVGWGPGWRGWVLIPLLVSALFGVAGLVVFGAVLFFLSKIENNLARAVRGHAVTAPKPVDVRPETLLTPPPCEEPAAVAEYAVVAGGAAAAATDLAIAAEQPVAQVELPLEIEAIAPVVETSPLEVTGEPLAEGGAALPELVAEVGPAAEVVVPVIPAPAPAGRFPSVEIFESELEIAAPKLEAVLPEARRVPAIGIAEPKVEASLPEARRVPAIEIVAPAAAAADDVTALRAQLAALQSRLAELEPPPAAVVEVPVPPKKLAAELPVTLPAAPEVEKLPVAAVGRLPGAEEAARIAAEMAALKPAPRHEAASPTLMAATGPLAAEARPPIASAPADDLLVIKGVGPTYARRLAEVGITTFAALAAASEELLDAVTIGLPGRAIREDWRGQARKLAG